MNYYVAIALGDSIFIAALIALFKFRKIDKLYYPFIYCIFIGAINEILSQIFINIGYNSALNNNIYVLIEALLITWQFKNWGILEKHKLAYRIFLAGLIIIWIIEYHNKNKLEHVNLYFRLIYSFFIAVFSVNILGKLIINSRKKLLTNPIFLFCCGFVLFFTYKIFIETFWIYGTNVNKSLSKNIYDILVWVNLVTNIIYSIALLCIPTKAQFITLY